MGLFSKSNSNKDAKSWYEDRYQNLLIQRNFLALLTILSIVGILFSVVAVRAVTLSKNVDPFVIEIDKKTGVATTVQPVKELVYSNDAAITRYFLVQYVQARESFNSAAYRYFYNEVVPLMSSQDVRNQFRSYLASPDSPIKYAGNTKYVREIIISSITKLPETGDLTTYRVEYIEKETLPTGVKKSRNRVSTISYAFINNLNLTEEERYINPLGFQVKYYTVADRVVQ